MRDELCQPGDNRISGLTKLTTSQGNGTCYVEKQRRLYCYFASEAAGLRGRPQCHRIHPPLHPPMGSGSWRPKLEWSAPKRLPSGCHQAQPECKVPSERTNYCFHFSMRTRPRRQMRTTAEIENGTTLTCTCWVAPSS